MKNLHELLTEASVKLQGWYCFVVYYKKSDISILIVSSVNSFVLTSSGWESSWETAVRNIADQLERDSQSTGRYSNNAEFRQMFSEAAKCLREGVTHG